MCGSQLLVVIESVFMHCFKALASAGINLLKRLVVSQGQLMGVALSFLRNFGILSGASGVLGALSSGVASAALDDRFAVQRAQQKQVTANTMVLCC